MSEKIVGGVHTFAPGEGDHPKSFLAHVAAAIVGCVPPRPEFKLDKKPSKRRVRGAQLAAVTLDEPTPAEPQDDPAYSEEPGSEYKAIRRLRGYVSKVAFYDAHGDSQGFDWHGNPRFRSIGDRYVILRFSGALVLLDGEHMRSLIGHITRGGVSEFREYRPIWTLPEIDPKAPLAIIRTITVIEQEPGAEDLSGQERELAQRLAEAETPVLAHG